MHLGDLQSKHKQASSGCKQRKQCPLRLGHSLFIKSPAYEPKALKISPFTRGLQVNSQNI